MAERGSSRPWRKRPKRLIAVAWPALVGWSSFVLCLGAERVSRITEGVTRLKWNAASGIGATMVLGSILLTVLVFGLYREGRTRLVVLLNISAPLAFLLLAVLHHH